MTLHGTSPLMIFDADHRRHLLARPWPRCLRPCAPARRSDDRHVLRPGLGEVAGEHPQQLLEPAVQRAVAVHLDAEVFEHRDAGGRGDAGVRHCADQLLVDTAARGVLGDRTATRTLRRSASQPVMCSSTQSAWTRPSCTSTATIADEAERVGARLHLQVEVGQLGGLAALRVDARSSTAPGRWRSPSARCGHAGSRGSATGSCRRTAPPRSARSRRAPCRRASCRSPRTRRSSPATARWRGTWPPSARSVAPL